jgi:hypothetical protein
MQIRKASKRHDAVVVRKIRKNENDKMRPLPSRPVAYAHFCIEAHSYWYVRVVLMLLHPAAGSGGIIGRECIRRVYNDASINVAMIRAW